MATESMAATSPGAPTTPTPPVPLPGIVRASPAALRLERRLAILLVFGPLVGTVVAIALLWGWAVGMTELVLLVVLYSLATVGIGVGLHRLAAHRSFQAPGPAGPCAAAGAA